MAPSCSKRKFPRFPHCFHSLCPRGLVILLFSLSMLMAVVNASEFLGEFGRNRRSALGDSDELIVVEATENDVKVSAKARDRSLKSSEEWKLKERSSEKTPSFPMARLAGGFQLIDFDHINPDEPMGTVPEELLKTNKLYKFCQRCKSCAYCSSPNATEAPPDVPENDIVLTSGVGNPSPDHLNAYMKTGFLAEAENLGLKPLLLSIWWCTVILSTSAIPFRLCNCNDNSPTLTFAFHGIEKLFSEPSITCQTKVCVVKLEGKHMKLNAKVVGEKVPLTVKGDRNGTDVEYKFTDKTISINVNVYKFSEADTTFYTVEEKAPMTLMQTFFDGDPPLIFKLIDLHRPAIGFTEVLEWPKPG